MSVKKIILLFLHRKQLIKQYRMKNILKIVLVLAVIFGLSSQNVALAKKKEKISDPRLLLVQKLGKSVKESQFLAAGKGMKNAGQYLEGFDVTDDETTLWYAQRGSVAKYIPGKTKIHEAYVIRAHAGSKKEVMTLRYFGGAENLCVEHTEDGDYIWIGSLGDKYTKGGKSHYMRTRGISRIKFEPGKEWNEGSAGETYYLGGGTNRYCYPAVDVQNDLLAVAHQNAGVVTLNIYHLSEAKALPETELRVKTHWKGEAVGEETETITRSFKGRDLSTLDPISSFVLQKPTKETGNSSKDPNFYKFQGYDVDKDYVYFVEGVNNGGKYTENGESKAFITVFDHNGKEILPKRRIQIVSEKMMLDNMGITSTDQAEVSGIKVKDGKIYIGFSAYGKASNGKNTQKACIVKYE